MNFMVVRLFLSKLGYFEFEKKKKMLKFFLNQKKCLFNKHFFFHFLAYFRRRFFCAFFCFFWFKKLFFFKCFFFQIQNILFYFKNEFYDHKIRRQGTLGSQRKICCRICHKNQHLLIYDDFGKKKKSKKMLFFQKFVVKKWCYNCFKC